MRQTVVFNMMLSRGLGGIEQAFIDYNDALCNQGHQVINIIHPKAKIREVLDAKGALYLTLSNWGMYDFFAVRKLKQMLRQHQSSAIITHGSRAAVLALKARDQEVVIAVSHHYNYKRLGAADYILATTEHMRQAIIHDGYSAARVFIMPNMITLPTASFASKKARDTTMVHVIGAMGRFEHKKGFDLLLRAVADLRHKGVECRLIIAGDGKQAMALKKLSTELNISNIVSYLGWVEDKASFFKMCDIFCIPSRHEPFGIVLLEAFAHQVPVVCTQTEGPSEIARHQKDAEMVPIDNLQALTRALQHLLQDKQYAQRLVKQAYDTVCKAYTMPVVAERLSQVLEQAVRK